MDFAAWTISKGRLVCNKSRDREKKSLVRISFVIKQLLYSRKRMITPMSLTYLYILCVVQPYQMSFPPCVVDVQQIERTTTFYNLSRFGPLMPSLSSYIRTHPSSLGKDGQKREMSSVKCIEFMPG